MLKINLQMILMSHKKTIRKTTPKLFSGEQNQENTDLDESIEDTVTDQLFDQDTGEENFEIPAFLRRQKF